MKARRSSEQARLKAVNIAQAVVEGKMGVIEGCRLISTLAPDLVADWKTDPDFLALAALDSETDDLPVGEQRKLWEKKALAERDKIVSKIEGEAKPDVKAACRNIIRRFAAQETTDSSASST